MTQLTLPRAYWIRWANYLGLSMKERDVTKLPMWAQEKIKNLESLEASNRAYFEEKIREMTGNDNTPVELEFCHDMRRWIPVRSRIIFHLANKSEVEICLNEDRDSLRVLKNGRSDDYKIKISPVCTNVVEVS